MTYVVNFTYNLSKTYHLNKLYLNILIYKYCLFKYNQIST